MLPVWGNFLSQRAPLFCSQSLTLGRSGQQRTLPSLQVSWPGTCQVLRRAKGNTQRSTHLRTWARGWPVPTLSQRQFSMQTGRVWPYKKMSNTVSQWARVRQEQCQGHHVRVLTGLWIHRRSGAGDRTAALGRWPVWTRAL